MGMCSRGPASATPGDSVPGDSAPALAISRAFGSLSSLLGLSWGAGGSQGAL